MLAKSSNSWEAKMKLTLPAATGSIHPPATKRPLSPAGGRSGGAQRDQQAPDRGLEPRSTGPLHSFLARVDGTAPKDRIAIASAFVAKAVYNFENNRDLLDRLACDRQLLAICGWKHPRQVPHESTFSRAFAEFAEMHLPQFVHEALIRETQKGRIIGHIARDSEPRARI